MNERYKFRGKRLDNGKWVYGDLLKPNGSCRIVNYEYSPNDMGVCTDFHYFDVEEESVGQYTGMKDKNGKDIYEGDIVEYGLHNYSVEYDYDMCRYIIRRKIVRRRNYNQVYGLDKNVTIIGNVIDNKELLNEK